MKYLLIINQTKKNWYLALINNKLAVSKNPKVYYESKDKAIMDLYTIKYSAIKRIKKLCNEVWKSKVSWKKFKRSYYKDSKYYIKEVEENEI